MSGIMPDVSSGAIVIRDLEGVCVDTAGEAPNAYCPTSTFISTCQITALAEDCSARVMPEQINALVSEIMCFAEKLSPIGPWNCATNCNLANLFQIWMDQFIASTTVIPDGETITGDGSEEDPLAVSPAGVVTAICADNAAGDALAACLVSTDGGNLVEVGTDGRLFSTVHVVAPILGDGAEDNPLVLDVPGLISADGRNIITEGTDGLLLATISTTGLITGSGTPDDPLTSDFDATGLAALICGDPDASETLAGCLISEDAGNALAQGTDGKMFASFDGATVKFEISFSRLVGIEVGEPLLAYVNALGFQLKAGLPELQVFTRDLGDDFRINMYHNASLVGYIETVAGVPAASFVSDMTFLPGVALEFRSASETTFSLLAITVVGLRAVEVV